MTNFATWSRRRALATMASLTLAGGASAAVTPPPSLQSFRIEDPPSPWPLVDLTDLDGRPISSHALVGKPMLVNFWATWCAPCIQELPTLGALARNVPEIAVVLLNSDRGNAPIGRFLDRTGTRAMINWVDREGDLGGAVVLRGMPTTILVDEHARIRARVLGSERWQQPSIAAFLRAFFAEKT